MVVLAAGSRVIIDDEKHNIPFNSGNNTHLSYDSSAVLEVIRKLGTCHTSTKNVPIWASGGVSSGRFLSRKAS